MRLICAQAHLSERYFYESFNTVRDLYLAVHLRLSEEVMGDIVVGITQQPEDDPLAQTRAGLTAFFEYIKADRRRAQILLLDAVNSGLTDPHNINTHVKKYADFVRMKFKKRYATLPAGLDLDLVVGGFVGMIVHTGSMWTAREFDTPVDVLVNHNLYAWRGLHAWLSDSARP